MLRPDGNSTRRSSGSPVKEQLIDHAWAEVNCSKFTSSSVLSAAPEFLDMVMSVLQEMVKVRTSFISLLQERQLAQLGAASSRVDLRDEQVLYREGDDSTFLGFVVSGKLKMMSGTDKLLDLAVGDVVGDMELCNPVGGSTNRQHMLLASGDAVVARIEYTEFLNFVEAMGPRKAKLVSRLLADCVLAKVVKQEQEAERRDRSRLQKVGRARRMAVSGPCSADLAIPHLGDQDPDAGAQELHVPFYFEELAFAEMASARPVIEQVMARIPLLACLNHDWELKQKVINSFMVAYKKTGQFIMHRGRRQDYFFIVFKGECGHYVEAPRPVQQVAGEGTVPVSRTGTAESSGSGRVPSNAGEELRRLPSHNSMASSSLARKSSVSPTRRFILATNSGSASPRRIRATNSGGASPLGTPSTSVSVAMRMTKKKSLSGFPTEANDLFSRRSSTDSFMLGAGVGNALQQVWEGGNGLGDLAAMLSKGASVKKAAKVVRARAQVHHHKHFELVKTVTAGEWFGDWALLIDSLSDINVKAVTDVTLLILPVKTFREIREAWEKRNFAFRIEYLRGSPFGKYLDDENLCKLADALVPQRVPAGQYFIDAESTDFYILQSGVAIELKHHVAITGRTNSGGPGGRVASYERRGASPTVPARGQSPGGRYRRFKIPDSDPNKVREHRDGACFCHRNLSMQNLDARTWMLSEEPNNPIIVAGSDCTFLVLDRKSFIDLVGTYESLVERWTKGTLVRSDAEANLFAAGGAKSLRRAVGAGISPSSPILALSSQVRVLV